MPYGKKNLTSEEKDAIAANGVDIKIAAVERALAFPPEHAPIGESMLVSAVEKALVRDTICGKCKKPARDHLTVLTGLCAGCRGDK